MFMTIIYIIIIMVVIVQLYHINTAFCVDLLLLYYTQIC